MIDPIAVAIDGVARGNIARLPLVVMAGALTSVGPCVAPRYVAMAALLRGRRPYLTIATFVTGMLVGYAALGFGIGVLGALAVRASLLYLVLAVVLAIAGVRTLLHDPKCDHEHGGTIVRPARLSGVFSLGAASAFVVSPCCTPVVAAIAGLAAFDGNAAARVTLLAGFALGHAAPLFLAAPGSALAARSFHAWNAGPSSAVVSGTLMIALGFYYGLLV
jgi:cytochrome c biogenesis protein CcdA